MSGSGAREHRLSGLDAVRFLACAMVLMTHIPGRLGVVGWSPFGPWGGNGVSLFFALSGYLLWLPFVDGRPRLFDYMLSRAGRILPALWLAAIVLVALRGGDLLWYLAMANDPRGYPIGVMWTLQAEVQFYVALPILALVRRPLAVPIVLGAASLAFELWLQSTPFGGGPVEAALPLRFWAFAPGMVLAATHAKGNRYWLAGGLACMALGAGTLDFWGGQYANVPSTLGAGLIVGWGVTAAPAGRRFWAAGAALSYGLYLWHVDLIEVFGVPGIPLLVAVAAGSYLLLERPVMRWVASAREHRRATVATAPA